MRRVAEAALVLALTLAATAPPASAQPRFRVIVHPQVKGSQIPRQALGSIFLKRGSRWSDGSAVRPVDQSLRSPLRISFSAEVLQQDPMKIQLYWQREIATGHVPPPVRSSDEEIVAFVAGTPGAIGYVSPEMLLPGSVREVEVVD